jgi:hypothetical protein
MLGNQESENIEGMKRTTDMLMGDLTEKHNTFLIEIREEQANHLELLNTLLKDMKNTVSRLERESGSIRYQVDNGAWLTKTRFESSVEHVVQELSDTCKGYVIEQQNELGWLSVKIFSMILGTAILMLFISVTLMSSWIDNKIGTAISTAIKAESIIFNNERIEIGIKLAQAEAKIQELEKQLEQKEAKKAAPGKKKRGKKFSQPAAKKN